MPVEIEMEKYKMKMQFTFLGDEIDLENIQPSEINIIDIAHPLSMQCRYCGNGIKFYSVAEHCILVARMVKPEFKKLALLHDASEAYMGDLIAPMKMDCSEYLRIEKIVSDVIYKKFLGHIPGKLALEVVHDADIEIRAAEARDNLHNKKLYTEAINKGIPIPQFKLECWDAETANLRFLESLTGTILS